MAFRVPTFNLQVNLWRKPNVVTNPPNRQFMANLSLGKRVMFSTAYNSASVIMSPPSELLCPKLTDIAGFNPANTFSDCVEVPAGSGRYYFVGHVEDVAKGFANEYRLAFIFQVDRASSTISTNPWLATMWPIPTP